MEIRDLVPPENGRLFVTGGSGDGKSTLIRRIDLAIDDSEIVIAFDSKGEWPARAWWQPWQKKKIPWQRLTRYMPLSQLEPGHYVYRTRYPDMEDPMVTRIIKWALKRKHVTLIFDEINNFCKGGYAHLMVSKALREGRAKFVRIIAGSQFPVKVPEEVTSQTSMVICFTILNPDHRKKMADTFHPGMKKAPEGRRAFYLWRKSDPHRLLLVQQEDVQDKRFFDESDQQRQRRH